MIKSQILVYGASEDLKKSLSDAVKQFECLEFCGFAVGMQDAQVMLDRLQCDVLLLTADSENAESLTLVRRAETLEKRPLIVVLSERSGLEETFPLCVTENKLVFVAPFDIASVLNSVDIRLNECKCGAQEVTYLGDGDKIIDEKLTKVFISSGIPPHIKGYVFLREAVKIAMRNPMMINNITRGLYPAIAEKYSTTPSKVERAIRHAIEVAWARGKIDNLNNIYGIKIFNKSDKPTNGELIALISDGMLTECI